MITEPIENVPTDPHLDPQLDDAALLALFGERPERAWELFLDRYAGLVLGTLRHLGFDHDEAMDRFVFVCEKLCENDFRRFSTISRLGDEGELVPWLRAVVRNLSVSWAWSRHGRKRLFASVADLPAYEQRVFELYFWHGSTPAEVDEGLRREGWDRGPLAVFEALETLFDHLDAGQRWRLVSQLARGTEPISADAAGLEAVAPRRHGPEAVALTEERRRAVEAAVGDLPARARLILRLRYEETLSLQEIADIVRVSVSTVKASLRSSLDDLRRRLAEHDPETGLAWSSP